MGTEQIICRKILHVLWVLWVCANDRAGPSYPVGTFGREKQTRKRLNSNTANLQFELKLASPRNLNLKRQKRCCECKIKIYVENVDKGRSDKEWNGIMKDRRSRGCAKCEINVPTK